MDSRIWSAELTVVGMKNVPIMIIAELLVLLPYRLMWILPSSRLVPVMNGTRSNLPCVNSFDGKSGYSPSGPSISGSKPKISGELAIEFKIPANISLELAFRKQRIVLSVVAFGAQDATPATNSCQFI